MSSYLGRFDLSQAWPTTHEYGIDAPIFRIAQQAGGDGLPISAAAYVA